MISVYFDSNIFRFLKNKSKLEKPYGELYSRLSNYIFGNKENFIFFYSHAHLLDLKNDHTQKKFEDLIYMEKVVDDNYLVHQFKAQKAEYLLVKPIEAYQSLEEDKTNINWTEFFNIDKYTSNLSTEQIKELKAKVAILENIRVKDLMPALDNLPKETKTLLNKFIPLDNPNANFINFLERLTSFSSEFLDDNSIYKDLRNIVTSNIKYTIDITTFDLNESYSGSEKQSHFLDFVKARINKKIYTQFDLHTQAYFHLDILGLEMEKTKKVKTKSMLNDGQHSYYAAYCDILVTDDIQLREKSKILYKLFAIETKVCSVEEFLMEAFVLELQTDSNENMFWEKLKSELKSAFIRTVDHNNPTKKVVQFYSKQFYLSYFNTLFEVVEGDNVHITFVHQINNYSHSLPGYKILEAVVNKGVNLFGLDDYGLGYFIYEKEVAEINNEQWMGRHWTKENISLLLKINTKANLFILVIFQNVFVCN